MTSLEKYGPWALILGGSEGVGAEFATQLATDGFNLVLVARKPAPLEETATAARALGAEVRTLSLDLTQATSVEEIIAATAELEVGLLIYNAGANSYRSEFLDGDLSGFQSVIDLNMTTQLALVQHFGRGMRDRGRGGILLVGAMAGYMAHRGQGIYAGVKAFGRLFAEALWWELKPHGIDVLELILGATKTPAMARAGLNFNLPGLRVAEPADVAREGLEQLPNGPLHVAGGNIDTVLFRSGMDRARLVEESHRVMDQMIPADDSTD